MHATLPELDRLYRIVDDGKDMLTMTTLATVTHEGQDFPVPCVEIGCASPETPRFILVGGMHGVERIGTGVVLAWLNSLVQRLHWDAHLQQLFEHVRLVCIPVVNPSGLYAQTRCNGNGIDLMRNAPIDASDPVPLLLGGHRLGPWLPWYRGNRDAPMEPELDGLARHIAAHLRHTRFALSLDCHSGFGARDRIWFPYAGSRQPFTHLAETYILHRLFQSTWPQARPYLWEPQHHAYMTHGDIWDWLHRQHSQQRSVPFLPLTLEMGSWLWLRKNPAYFLATRGFFDPIKPHRRQRVLRQHTILLDFLLHATANNGRWLPDENTRSASTYEAQNHWQYLPSPHQ